MDRPQLPGTPPRRRHRRHRRTGVQGTSGRAHRGAREHPRRPSRGGVHALLVLPVAGARAPALLVQGPVLPVPDRPRAALGPRRVRARTRRGRGDPGLRLQLRGSLHGAPAAPGRNRTAVRRGPRGAGHQGRDGRGGAGRHPVSGPGGHADPAYLLDASGPAAPPRDNGELVFRAPWESKAFGLALALNEAGLIDWEDFRQALIREIGDWEAAHPSGEGWSYYECWLRALERTASARGLVDPRALDERAV